MSYLIGILAYFIWFKLKNNPFFISSSVFVKKNNYIHSSAIFYSTSLN